MSHKLETYKALELELDGAVIPVVFHFKGTYHIRDEKKTIDRISVNVAGVNLQGVWYTPEDLKDKLDDQYGQNLSERLLWLEFYKRPHIMVPGSESAS